MYFIFSFFLGIIWTKVPIGYTYRKQENIAHKQYNQIKALIRLNNKIPIFISPKTAQHTKKNENPNIKI